MYNTHNQLYIAAQTS